MKRMKILIKMLIIGFGFKSFVAKPKISNTIKVNPILSKFEPVLINFRKSEAVAQPNLGAPNCTPTIASTTMINPAVNENQASFFKIFGAAIYQLFYCEEITFLWNSRQEG